MGGRVEPLARHAFDGPGTAVVCLEKTPYLPTGDGDTSRFDPELEREPGFGLQAEQIDG
jgi:hypothetical protein